jgi:energy-coupling factor transport system ATP-binding protein
MLEGKELSNVCGGEGNSRLGVLPQNPEALFVKKTVREDLLEILKKSRLQKETNEKKLSKISKLCQLDELMNRHPYDLSGGEQQRAALAKVLLLEPKILLLDEPTKGLDVAFKQVFAGILEDILHHGVTIVMVSHDIEFCAKYADRCAMFFDGQIVTEGTPRAFFSGNSFYTTSANRMARHLLPEAITAEDVIVACGGETPPLPNLVAEDDEDGVRLKEDVKYTEHVENKLPIWRKVIAWAAGIMVLITAYLSLAEPNIPWLMNNKHMGLYIVLIASALALALAVSRKSDPPIKNVQVQLEKRKLSKRTILASVMILLAIPITIYIGIFYFGDRKYYFISLLIILETMLPFALIFEGRKPQARELIIISVLCALGVAGRAAFFMLPEVKPIAAMVIISGVAFGGETGFLVGSVTMLVSNIMFGQGPWTPWQMFAMGMIGFIAGILFRKGVLRRNRLTLCIFGGLATLIIYGGLMNPASVIMFYDNPTWPMFLSAYLLGFPFDLVHASATVIFLWFIVYPMLEKLERIKVKYGMIEKYE